MIVYVYNYVYIYIYVCVFVCVSTVCFSIHIYAYISHSYIVTPCCLKQGADEIREILLKIQKGKEDENLIFQDGNMSRIKMSRATRVSLF